MCMGFVGAAHIRLYNYTVKTVNIYFEMVTYIIEVTFEFIKT